MSGSEQKVKKEKRRWRDFFSLLRRRPVVFFLRILSLTLVILTALGLALYFSFKSEIYLAFSEWVERQTPRLFKPATTFTGMEMPDLGHFIFHDFKIADPFGGPVPFVEASKVEVIFSPMQILRNGINLASIDIQGARFLIRKDPVTGETSFSGIFKAVGSGKGPGTRVRIRQIVLDSCRVRLEDLEDEPIENDIHHFEGRMTHIAGEDMIEVFDLRVNTSYWSLGDVRLSGVFDIRGGYLGFSNIEVVKGATDLRGEGFVNFDTRQYQYTVSEGPLEMAHLPPELGMREHLSGTARVSAAFGGSFDSSLVRAEVALREGVIFGYPVNDFSTRLEYHGDVLRFQKLGTGICGGRLECEMEFRFGKAGDGYRISAGGSKLRVEKMNIPEGGRLRGVLSGRVELEGQGYSTGDLRLAGTALSITGDINGIPLDSAQVKFNYQDGKVRLDNLYINSGGGVASAIGDIDRGELFLFLILEKMPVVNIDRIFSLEGLSGRGDFSGSLTGELFNPNLKGTISMEKGVFGEVSFSGMDGSIEFHHLFKGLEGKMELTLLQGEMASTPFDWVHAVAELPDSGGIIFSPLVLVQDSLNNLTCSGFFRSGPGKGQFRLSADSLELVFRGEKAASAGPFELTRSGDTLSIPRIAIHALGGTMEGGVELAGSQWMEAEMELEGIDFSRVPRVFNLSSEVSGKLGGRLQVSGKPSEPACNLQAELENARYGGISSQRVKALMTLQGNELAVEQVTVTNPNSEISISGHITLPFAWAADSSAAAGGPHPINIQARLDQFPISSISSELVQFSQGALAGEVRVNGTLEQPVLGGELSLSGGKGIITYTNTRLGNMSGRVDIQGQKMVLRDFSSQSPEGKLSLSGEILFSEFQPESYDLTIAARDLVLQQFKYVTRVRLNSDLTLKGPVSKPMLAGGVFVTDGELSASIGPTAAGDQEQAAGNNLIRIPHSPVDYDLQIKAQDNFFLRNRNATIKLNADLKAVQRDAPPQISGEINTLAGTYFIYGRRFRIGYGAIQFRGEGMVDPVLNINAERTIRGKVLRVDAISATGGAFQGSGRGVFAGEQYEIDRNTFYLHIGGTLTNPQFEITVKDKDDREIEPPLTPQEARTLVIIDQTYQEFTQQSSLSQSKVLDQVANLALNQANPYIQELTGIDEFSFESQLFGRTPTETQSTEKASAKITMGEFLFETVFFSFSQDLLDPSAQSVQIEYLIGKNSSIVGQTDSRGHFNLDFKYLIKY